MVNLGAVIIEKTSVMKHFKSSNQIRTRRLPKDHLSTGETLAAEQREAVATPTVYTWWGAAGAHGGRGFVS